MILIMILMTSSIMMMMMMTRTVNNHDDDRRCGRSSRCVGATERGNSGGCGLSSFNHREHLYHHNHLYHLEVDFTILDQNTYRLEYILPIQYSSLQMQLMLTRVLWVLGVRGRLRIKERSGGHRWRGGATNSKTFYRACCDLPHCISTPCAL